MEENTTYSGSAQYLEKVFTYINKNFFDGDLEMPTITIQSTVGAYGHVTIAKVWKTKSGKASNELNIGADYLNRPIAKRNSGYFQQRCLS